MKCHFLFVEIFHNKIILQHTKEHNNYVWTFRLCGLYSIGFIKSTLKSRCPQDLTNRTIIGLHAIHTMLNPNTSSTCYQNQQYTMKLEF
jgi:hypothetical protein